MTDMLTGALLGIGLFSLAGLVRMEHAEAYGIACLGIATVRMIVSAYLGVRARSSGSGRGEP